MKVILLALALLLTGCSYTRHIGTVGTKRFTKVQLGSLTAPGQTLIVIEDTNTHEVTIMAPMGGNGVVPSLLTAGGIAGGAVALGSALESDNRNTTTINIADDPPSPLIPPNNRPPANRPPPKGWK